MSMIDKMAILGIRSFGVKEEDRQIIEFQHPLTLIVGQNGAGKTTVIECLKYATTGDQPGNTKGGAFVHDPKLAGESEVRAQVALTFKDLQGRDCSIKRSLQVTQKSDKIVMKTLDSVISKLKEGELVSTTSKCADINAEMVISLGVSKAVLENVIFCHQEDSNWPLSEGKVLKSKFDEIFAATRYIKALDIIKVTKKEKDKSYREENTRLPYLESNRDTANAKKETLREHEYKLTVSKETARQVKEKMKPLELKLNENAKKREDIVEIDRKLQQNHDRQKHLIEDRKALEERIKNLFHGSDEQLHQLIQSQETMMTNKKSKLENCQSGIEPIRKNISQLTNKKSDLILKQGQLQQESNVFNREKQTRKELVSKLSVTHNLCKKLINENKDLSETDAARFESEMKNLVRKHNEAMIHKQKKHEENVNNFVSEIQKVWAKKTEIEEGVKHKQQSVKEKQRKMEEISREISNLRSSTDVDRLEELQKKLEQAERELKTAEQADTNHLKEEVNHLTKLKSQDEHERKLIDDEIVNMQRHEQSRTTIEVLKKQKLTKEDSMRRLKIRNFDSLCSIELMDAKKSFSNQSFPSRQNLNQLISRKTDEEKILRKELDNKKQELTKFSTRLDVQTNDLRQKSLRFKKIEDEMFELCGSEDFEEELKQVELDINELQGSKGLTDGIQFMYKEFLKKLRNSNDHADTPCPLCHRLFDEAKEIEELAEELDRKLELAPQKMLTQERDLEQKQKRYQMLLQQRPAKEEMDKLQSEVIPVIKSQISDYKSKITEARQSINEKEEKLRNVQEEYNVAQSCSNDVAHVETMMNEIRDLSRKIEREEAQLPGSGNSGQTFESLNEEKQRLSTTIQKYSKSIDEKRDLIERQVNTLLVLGDDVKALQGEKLKIAANVEKCKQMNESQKTLAEEIKELKRQCRDSESKTEPLERQLAILESEKNSAKQTQEEEVKSANEKLQSVRNSYQELNKSNTSIKEYLDSGRENLLKNTQIAAQRLETNLKNKEEELNKLREEISLIEKELATCNDRRRDLDDNLALRKQDENIKEITNTIKKLEIKLGGMDSRKLEKETTQLSKDWHSLVREKERCSTRHEEVMHQVNAVKQELEKEDLKLAEERHKDCLIKVTTTKLAIEDLEKYHNALDRAIMRYHSMKMSEINKIIKEIWSETYRGHDIDFIEICSDEDTTTSTTARRVYNYRLVKCSRGQRIDMRGRCSAGQKVLASLVIRLALAETFCINCGILALDEPTTNLDRHHIESLAGALLSIIKSREAQRNFQLIIITHDEDFVELLGRSSFVDHFFRVEKIEGKSRISKCAIETLE